MTTTNEGAVKQAANEAALEIDNDPELAQSLIPSLARQRKLAWIIIKHLSASVPEQAAGSAFDTKHGGFIEQSPRVCSKCGHEQSVIQGRCVRDCGSHKCEFPT